jgi:hypothetical protein
MGQNLDTWAVLELFGHQEIAGMVTEHIIGGQAFVRVDVPAVNGNPEFTKLYNASAIYGITPTTEDIVRAFLSRNAPAPIKLYQLDVSALLPPGAGPVGETEQFKDDPDCEGPTEDPPF